MTGYLDAVELLTPPTERAAFSDRQAYVCAELSRLAYFKFEGGHALDEALALIRSFLSEDRYKELEAQLTGLIDEQIGQARFRKGRRTRIRLNINWTGIS